MLKRLSSRYTLMLGFAFLVTTGANAAAPAKFTIVGIGDSITKAFNANSYFRDSPEVSWATGTKKMAGFESHLEKLQKLMPQTTVTGFNYAVTGAVINDLSAQVKKANAAKPDYLTLLIGANDVCNWTEDYQESLDTFTATLKKNLDSLVAANPKIKITVSAMPDVYRLWELSKTSASCQRVWGFIGLCKQLLGKKLTDQQRLAFKQRWDHANSNIGSAAALYPQNVKYSDYAATYEFSKDDISTHDCFHPSAKGQNTLAQGTWAESWFAGQNLAEIE